RLTSRHIGGGHKQKYRKVDFKRRKRGVAAEVIAIEYDPNRSARIALIKYADGELNYILAPSGLRVGSTVAAGNDVAPDLGNALAGTAPACARDGDEPDRSSDGRRSGEIKRRRRPASSSQPMGAIGKRI